MPKGLDLRDLDEVRRRVVVPVVDSLIRPDEHATVDVEIRPDVVYGSGEPDESLEVVVMASGEGVTNLSWPVGHGLLDAELLAAVLYERLRDELCETRFA